MLITRESLRLALQLVRRAPGRSGLTMLGLAIGVGAFIAMVSFGEGARRSVVAQFELLGTNLIKIQSSAAVGPRARPPALIDDADVARLRREGSSLRAVLPVARRNASLSRGGEQHASSVYGADPGYLELHAWELQSGGGFDDVDAERSEKVCVIGGTPARALFGGGDPLGQTLTVAGLLPCHIVGVLSEKGFSTSGNDLDDLVVVPLTTFNAHLGDQPGYAYIEVEPLWPARIEAALEEVREIMRRSHDLEPGEPDDFSVSSPLEVIRAADRTSRILSTLLAAIAGVSLLVGGIGIMNIQLVSVAERTGEIGIRAAIGASPAQILAQFLLESLVLTLLGTLAGIALGVLAATLVAERMGWPRVISPAGVALAAGFGTCVGMCFGYLPARRASGMDPIHALHRE
ncbi:MAG TPA: ABC transporter permease [Polyangiaceae bacterium]